GDNVHRLKAVGELVGPDLVAPGVGGDRGDLFLGDPGDRIEAEAGRRAARIGAPAVPQAAAHVSRADQQDAAGLDPDVAHGGGGLQVADGDRVAVLQRIETLRPRKVEEDAAADERGLQVLHAV